MLARHSLKVGMGKEAGRLNAGRGGGSWNIAWLMEWCEELCLYLWPLRAEMLLLITGLFAMLMGWKLKGVELASPDRLGVK